MNMNMYYNEHILYMYMNMNVYYNEHILYMNMYMYMCTIDVIVGFILWAMAEMLWRSVHEYLLLLVLFSGVVEEDSNLPAKNLLNISMSIRELLNYYIYMYMYMYSIHAQ